MTNVRDTITRCILWLGILALSASTLPRLQAVPLNDFIEYWSAARLFVSGGNPYSQSEMLAIQHGVGWDKPQPLMLFNPPWVLPLLAPLAAFPMRTAQVLWFVASASLLFASANLLWHHYGGRPDQRLIAWGCAALFFPDPVALRMGQLAPIILFGLTAFLLCFRAHRPWLSGLSLFVVGIKPHLLIPLAVAVLIWVVTEKRWQIFAATVIASAVATAAAAIVNPVALTGYVDLWTITPPIEFVSGFGGLLRLVFGFERAWLQLLPAVFGIGWIFLRWHRHRTQWDWSVQLPALVLASFISAPYGWTFDQPILLVAIMYAAVLMAKHPRPAILAAFVIGNLIMAALVFVGFSDGWFLWSAPLWAFLYSVAVNSDTRKLA